MPDPLQEGRLLLDDHLGRGRGRRGPEVGDEIGDGEVDLVADGRDDGHGRAGDGPGHGLLVEGPQVLDGAAAAADDEDLDTGPAAQGLDALDDLGRGALALDAGRVDDDVEPGVAALEDAQDIADGRPRRRGHDADRPRPERQLALAGLVEQALGPELLLELLEAELEGALALGLDLVDVELVVAAGLEDADLAPADDLEAVLEVEGDLAGGRLPQDGLDDAFLVLEAEEDVAGGGLLVAGDLALDPDLGDGDLEGRLDDLGDLGDRVDPVLDHQPFSLRGDHPPPGPLSRWTGPCRSRRRP